MYDSIQLLDAAQALYPRRLYDDERPSAQASLVLAAVVDFKVHYSKPAIGIADGVMHPGLPSGDERASFRVDHAG